MSDKDELYRDAPPAPASVRDQARRVLAALHGASYVYRAPETFDVVQRWVWAVAHADDPRYLDEVTQLVEAAAAASARRDPDARG